MLAHFLPVLPIDCEIEVGVGEPSFMDKWLNTDGVVPLFYLVECELSEGGGGGGGAGSFL